MSRKKLYLFLGILLIFISANFYSSLIIAGAIEFGGVRLQEDIERAEDMTNPDKPSETFYTNAYLQAIYGTPITLIGIYLIVKNTKNI